jgi:hypothetical protein
MLKHTTSIIITNTTSTNAHTIQSRSVNEHWE